MSIYPNATAGQRIKASLISSTQPMIAVKAVNTDRTTTTTPTADPELTLTLEANAVYLVEFYLHYAAVTTVNFRTSWSVPSGASGLRSVRGLASTVADSSSTPAGGGAGSIRSGVHAFTTTVDYGGRNSASNQVLATEESIVTTTSAGSCAIQWSQASSSATATRLGSGSWVRATRLS